MEELPIAEITKVLLQDSTFLKEWKQVSDALDNTTNDMFVISSKLNSGNATMYDIIQWMLEAWRGRNGKEANLWKFIEILEKENLKNAVDLLKDHFNLQKGIVLSVAHIEVIASNNIASKGMQQRNLVVLERIDRGTFSEVFKVNCVFDEKKYAVKRICLGTSLQHNKTVVAGDASQLLVKLMREVKLMARLPENPNIVVYSETWFEGPLQKTLTGWWLTRPELNAMEKLPFVISDQKLANSTYMCIKMELMDTNLAQWLRCNRGYGPTVVFTIAKTITRQILNGLAFIHGQQIVHRDLKPKNIMLNTRGFELSVKIGDFGLSRELSEVDTALTMQVGGRQFASPEMERGDEYNFKTDIFSVGLIVLVMLHPFESTKQLERTLDDARRGSLEIIDSLEAKYGQPLSFFRVMLSRKPEDRPSAADALAAFN